MKQTESCRKVRGAWEVCIEYLHKLCTEQRITGKRYFRNLSVGCTGMRPLSRRSIDRYVPQILAETDCVSGL